MTDRTAALRTLFATARTENRAILLPYMTAGLPDAESSLSLFEAMADAGADGFEIGIPYADPLMDGPVIQEAGNRALAGGMTLDKGLDIVSDVVGATGKPCLVMTYVNPVLAMGAAGFATRAAQAGASGVIIADLPADEAVPIATALADVGLGMVLFVAPTTDDQRLRAVAEANPVFLYGIAELGVTGRRETSSSHAAMLAGRVRAVTDIPLVLGVGVSTPEQAADAAAVADGVIVGSALVKRVLDAPDAAHAATDLAEAVSALAAAIRR